MHEPIKRPAFLYYGSKFRLARHYPAPQHEMIVEPFAGAAGYSLRYYWHKVVLIDRYDVICEVWRYLVRARPEEILALPLLGADDTVDDFAIPQEAKWLLGFWLNTAVAAPVKKFSSWGKTKTFGHGEKDPSKPEWSTRPDNQYWTAGTRAHVASVAAKVKHWHIENASYVETSSFNDADVTWFIDPPYQKAGKYYKHSAQTIDFTALRDFAISRKGQVIVCENEGATWLPFRTLTTSRSASGCSTVAGKRRMTNHEVVWTNATTDLCGDTCADASPETV